MKYLALLLLVACSCKDKAKRRDDAAAPSPVRDAALADADTAPWPEIAHMPIVEPVRVIALPARPDVPRFTVGGPVITGDVAVVSSSQFGFIAVDFRRGQIAWTKPSGSHVAPPQLAGGHVILIGDCTNPPEVDDRETLLGCMRVVTPTGADEAYLAIHGKTKAVAEFAASAGEQHVDPHARGVVWRRGDAAVVVDLVTGVATPVPATEPPVVVTYKDRTWRVRMTEDGNVAAEGKPSWRTEQSYTTLLGAVYLPEQTPMVRASRASIHEGKPELLLFDIDATGSLGGQVSLDTAPGIGLIGHAISSVGDVALAVRLDKSLERDYIAAYAANALLMWVYPLPRVPRPDHVGLAIAHDAVVAFHDGDTLTVLPELSAPPTAPGAVHAPSENATP